MVNLSEMQSQALIQIPWTDLTGKICWLADALSAETYERHGTEMLSPGLFVDLKPWARHCFHVQSSKPRQPQGGDRMTRQRSESRTSEEETDVLVLEHLDVIGS